MTARPDTANNNLRIAITGTLVVHALLFLLLAWMFAKDAALRLWNEAHKPPPEPEVTLLFPEQFMPPPPPVPVPQKPEVYMRTSQNQASDTAPKNAAFIADRNTIAAATKAASPGATEPMPSMDGLKLPSRELADRDYRDGQLKDDAVAKTPPKEVAMMQPQPPAPPSLPSPPAVAPTPATPTPMAETPKPAQTVAKATTDTTPLIKMMEELSESGQNRLPIDLKKAEKPEKTDPDTPPKAIPVPKAEQVPEMPQSAPPETAPQKPVPKALPVLDEEVVTRTTRNQDPNSFTPHTRTSQVQGTISNRGAEAAVDAEATPKGRYIRQVLGQVEKKWNIYRVLRRDGVTYGSLQIVFYVNRKGKVEGLNVVNSKESNPILTDFTLQAVKDAEIPPMPADVVPSLPMNDQGRLKIEYNVLIY